MSRNIYLVVSKRGWRRLGPILRRPWRNRKTAQGARDAVLFSSEIFARNSRERGSEILLVGEIFYEQLVN